MDPFNPNTISELDASSNKVIPHYMVYRRYGNHEISPCMDLGFFTLLSEANLAASKLCSTESGNHYSKQEFSDGHAVYKRLGQGNWGPDDIVMIYTGLQSIPIMATIPKASYGVRYMVYRRYGDYEVSRCLDLGRLGFFNTLDEANRAAGMISVAEFGEGYEKEEFNNGLVAYKRLGQENWGPGDTIMFYTSELWFGSY